MNSQNDEIIDGICDYAEKKQIKSLLQEYLKRVILEKPDQPVTWLKNSITENPYTPPAKEN
jgi:hypothetical protein